MRPTCDKILALPSVLPKIQSEKIKLADDDDIEQDVLLNTIKIPKNLAMLTDRLPKPTYNNVDFKSIGSKKGAIETKPRLLPEINKNSSKNELPSEISYNASTKNSRPQSKHDTDGHSNQPEMKPVRKHKVLDTEKHSEVRGGGHDRHPVVDRHNQERAEHIELAKVQGRHLKHREIPEEIRVEPEHLRERNERLDRAEQRERERQR